MNSGSFKNNKICSQSYKYQIYLYQQDLALNNLQWLICHKTNAPNQKKWVCPGYDTTPHPIMRLQFWGKGSTPSLPLLPGPP